MSLGIFDTLYKKLNNKQKEAVDNIEGPVMVIAGPGTGKTTVLTLRIANILKKTDTPANGILAITYTEAGVNAIRSKLHGIIGDRAHDVRIHTFHGFASSIIAEYPDHFLHINEMKIMTDIEQESLIRSIISDPKFSSIRPAGKPDVYVSGIIRSIDDSKREALNPEMVRIHAEEQIIFTKNSESSISTRGITKGQLKAEAKEFIEKAERTKLFSEVYEIYENKKHENLRLDFNDLIIELLLTLRKDELLLRLIQERYLYIHVDEHQDTNDAQNFIIGLIAEFFETPNIFIVGDEKQAIYRFQGASVENFLLLQKRWPAMKVISLDTNYRSHQSILDASFSMIEKNYEPENNNDLRIYLNSKSEYKIQPIDIITGENITASELYLVNSLKSIKTDETVAIIVRRNRDLDKVIRLLETHNIPVSSERSVDIFSHPVGRLFFDLLEYVNDPSKVDSLAKTIISCMWNLSFENSTTLIKSLRSGNLSEIKNNLPGLKIIQNNLLSDNPLGFIINSATNSNFINLISKDPSYIHVWRGIVNLAESLVREKDIKDPLVLIQSILAYRLSAETRTVKVSVGAPDSYIKALTAHGSKGLEFDHVYIPYATDEAWIGRPKGASFILPKKRTIDSDVKDIRRLFYVALTRARKHVTILTSLEENNGTVLSPLRFISELDDAHTKHILLPRIAIEKGYSTEINSDNNKTDKISLNSIDQRIIDITKNSLIEKGLSVTALNHFIKCPNTFIYQSILKMPQAPAISAEKGTAMHVGLSRVWKNKERTVVDIQTILTSSIEEYFQSSFLSISEKQSAKNELIKTIPDVAKALVNHFKVLDNSTMFTEAWVKTEFKGNYENSEIMIPLHGKLDAIVDNGSQVDVYDYKTKQAMSITAIKGETKSSDGNYFRQLIFYKLLVGNDNRWRSRYIVPSLVFVSPDDKGRCPTVSIPIESSDIDRVKKEIQTLIESVWSGKITKAKCDDEKCIWCGLRGITQ